MDGLLLSTLWPAVELHTLIVLLVTGLFAARILYRYTYQPLRPARPPLGISVACCSDTHGKHRNVQVPDADIFIHAGDFTRFGKRVDAEDFNQWLGELPHQHKVVVNGNHEYNADWKAEVKQIVTNATFLCGQEHAVEIRGVDVKMYGTEFFWPMKTPNPYYDQIPEDLDILICHGPVKGYVDGGKGCQTMLSHVERAAPRLVVSGHIHFANGVVQGKGKHSDSTFVNAANAVDNDHHKLRVREGIVVQI